MVNPHRDYMSEAEVMKARLAKIKADPERALFSDFKGRSPSGAVTARVDLLGRLKRIEFNPGTLYEGGEQWLMDEIMAACREATHAANFLNFDLAELAQELDQAPALKTRAENAENERARQRAAEDRRDDDSYYDEGGSLR